MKSRSKKYFQKIDFQPGNPAVVLLISQIQRFNPA